MRLHSGFHKNRKANTESSLIPTLIAAILFSVLLGIPLMGEAFFRYRLDSISFRKIQHQVYANPKTGPARGRFLIASSKLIDPNFSKTVVLLINYARHGAMGVIINRPSQIKLSTVLPDIKGLKQRPDTVYMGGPVARNQIILLVKSKTQPKESFHVFGNIYIGPNVTVIQQMIDRSDSKEAFRVYAGYAGWAAGQLDNEISRGDWHVLQADEEALFHKTPSKIWPELIRLFSSQWVRAPKQNRIDRVTQKTAAAGIMTHLP